MTASQLSNATPQEQFQELTRGVVDLHTADELRSKLVRSYGSQTPLLVKVGFDPSRPDLHLGHTLLLNRMRRFQEFGHRVVFLIGDFTGMIGDPSGRNVTRPALTSDEVKANAETYKQQVFKILDPETTEIRFNSEWLRPLGAEGLLRLAARYPLARMLERDDFKTRFREGRSIAIHELIYPLLQGYDSVELRADVELGATDQLFNLLVGRQLMREYQLEPQVIMTGPILEGLDAKVVDGKLVGEKMSKSLGNYVAFNEDPHEIFGKLMSINDDLMWRKCEGRAGSRDRIQVPWSAGRRACRGAIRAPLQQARAAFGGRDARARSVAWRGAEGLSDQDHCGSQVDRLGNRSAKADRPGRREGESAEGRRSAHRGWPGRIPDPGGKAPGRPRSAALIRYFLPSPSR